jgi:ribosome-binding factor A
MEKANPFKNDRLISLLQESAGDFLARNSNGTSLITVTRVELGFKAKSAKILISVLPESQEKAALDFASRNIDELKKVIWEKARIGRLPFLQFALDTGEKNRQKVDTLI